MHERIAHHILDNGLTIICLPKNSAPICSVQLWYSTGSANETNGIHGVSHILEHMMFRGSANYASQEHARRINETGGNCNAATAEDFTVFINNVPSRFLELVLQLEADRMQTLSLDPELLEIERNVIIEEFHTYMNNPATKAFLEFRKEFFKGHPYALSALGTHEDIAAVTAQQCREYYETWYTPRNATLVITGDVASTDQVLETVQRYFGSIDGPPPKKPRTFDSSDTRIGSETRRMTRKIDFQVPMLITGYPAPPSSSDDALALEMLQGVLSHGDASRLYRALVRQRSLAVMVSGMNHLMKHAGMSLFVAAFTPDTPVKKIERALINELERVITAGIEEMELLKIKNNALTDRVFELYSTEQLCHKLGYSHIIDGDFNKWVHRLEMLSRLKSDDLIDISRRYFNDSQRYMLHLKPSRANPMLFVAGIAKKLFSRSS